MGELRIGIMTKRCVWINAKAIRLRVDAYVMGWKVII